MGVQKDAGELLKFMYDRYTQGSPKIASQEIINETGWEANRINNAIDYLDGLGVLKITRVAGNTGGVKNVFINGLNPLGIDIIENKDKFTTTFGFEVGIPGFKFSWTREKRH
ncbi:MAG: hypothetical protein JW878_03355 [Methanomicrobia archaeon]|nr:hypothetical protein [Methanomicrobia archaeon]